MTNDGQSTTAPRLAKPRKRRRVLRWCFLLVAILIVAAALAYQAWRRMAVPRDAPVVGLSLDTAWHSRLGITTRTYEIALTRVGARQYDIRPGDRSAEEILDRVDALLLAGGGDVDPSLYGGAPEAAQLVDRQRDDLEIALIRGALDRNMPILGICRGIQILNVACGGTLRDLREDEALAGVHGITTNSLEAHMVSIGPDSRLAAIVKVHEQEVNSFHGQAVDRVGQGLKAVARSPDGVIEALEHPDHPLVVTVQWHPEILSLEDPEQLALFEELVAQAKKHRDERAP